MLSTADAVDSVAAVAARRVLGVAAWRSGVYADAESWLSEALEVATRAGLEAWRAVVLDGLGLCRSAVGDAAAAERAQVAALGSNERVGNPYQAVQNLVNLSGHARRRGDATAALHHAREAVARARAAGYRTYVPHALTQQAAAELAAGDARAALEVADEASALAVAVGDGYVRIWSGIVRAAARHGCGEASAAACLAEAMTEARRVQDRKQLSSALALAAELAVAHGHGATAALAAYAVHQDPAAPSEAAGAARTVLRRLRAVLPRRTVATAAAEAAALGTDAVAARACVVLAGRSQG